MGKRNRRAANRRAQGHNATVEAFVKTDVENPTAEIDVPVTFGGKPSGWTRSSNALRPSAGLNRLQVATRGDTKASHSLKGDSNARIVSPGLSAIESLPNCSPAVDTPQGVGIEQQHTETQDQIARAQLATEHSQTSDLQSQLAKAKAMLTAVQGQFETEQSQSSELRAQLGLKEIRLADLHADTVVKLERRDNAFKRKLAECKRLEHTAALKQHELDQLSSTTRQAERDASAELERQAIQLELTTEALIELRAECAERQQVDNQATVAAELFQEALQLNCAVKEEYLTTKLELKDKALTELRAQLAAEEDQAATTAQTLQTQAAEEASQADALRRKLEVLEISTSKALEELQRKDQFQDELLQTNCQFQQRVNHLRRVLWQWCGVDGSYNNYDDESSELLECSYQAHEGSVRWESDGVETKVDFETMEQYRANGNRLIRRYDLDGPPMGERWRHQDVYCVQCDVNQGTTDYSMVEHIFFDRAAEGSISRENFQIVRLQRIQNQLVLREFLAKRRNISDLRGPANLQEQYLFHGTHVTNPSEIVQSPDGFVTEYSRENCLFGRASYFAEFSRYSHEYCYRSNDIHGLEPNRTGKYCHMIVAQVLCGLSKQEKAAWSLDDRKKGRLKLTNSYDSVNAGPFMPRTAGRGQDDSRMFVVYQSAQAIPEFVITYTAKLGYDPEAGVMSVVSEDDESVLVTCENCTIQTQFSGSKLQDSANKSGFIGIKCGCCQMRMMIDRSGQHVDQRVLLKLLLPSIEQHPSVKHTGHAREIVARLVDKSKHELLELHVKSALDQMIISSLVAAPGKDQNAKLSVVQPDIKTAVRAVLDVKSATFIPDALRRTARVYDDEISKFRRYKSEAEVLKAEKDKEGQHAGWRATKVKKARDKDNQEEGRARGIEHDPSHPTLCTMLDPNIMSYLRLKHHLITIGIDKPQVDRCMSKSELLALYTQHMIIETRQQGVDKQAVMDQALFDAAGRGDTMLDTMARWLEWGASIDSTHESRQTPLHNAARNNQPATIKFLLDNGCDPNSETDGYPSLPNLILNTERMFFC